MAGVGKQYHFLVEMNWLKVKVIIRCIYWWKADPEVLENNRELEEKAGFWAVGIIIYFWLHWSSSSLADNGHCLLKLMQWSPLRKVRGAQLLKEMVKPESDIEEAEENESWTIFVGISRDFRLVSFWHFLFALRCTDLVDSGFEHLAFCARMVMGDNLSRLKNGIEANRGQLRPSEA